MRFPLLYYKFKANILHLQYNVKGDNSMKRLGNSAGVFFFTLK